MNFNVSSWRKDTTSEKISQMQSPSNKAPASVIVRLKFYVNKPTYLFKKDEPSDRRTR